MSSQRKPVQVEIAGVARAEGPQGQLLVPIVHSGAAPGTALSTYEVRMPPGHLSKAHVHRDSDVIVHIMHGWAATLWGEDMQPLVHGPGQQVWIPAGVPHAALNLAAGRGVVALEVRNDPDANRDVELLPDLDVVAADRVATLTWWSARGSSNPHTDGGQR